MLTFKRTPWYSWDKIKHTVLCKLSPSYRQKSRHRTQVLIQNLKLSREAVIDYIHANLIFMEGLYNDMVKRSDLFGSEILRSYEKKIIFHREVLSSLDAGKSVHDFNVLKLLNNIFLTTDPLILESHRETIRHRKNNS